MPLPRPLATAAKFILNNDLCYEIETEQIDLNRLKNLAEDARRLSLHLDRKRLRFVSGHKISRLMARLEYSPDDLVLLEPIGKTIAILKPAISASIPRTPRTSFSPWLKADIPRLKQKRNRVMKRRQSG